MLVFQQSAQKEAPIPSPERAAIEKFNSALQLQKTLQASPSNLDKAIQLYENALKGKNLPENYANAARQNLASLLIARAQMNQTSDSTRCKNDVLRLVELDKSKSGLLSVFAYNMIIPVPGIIKKNPARALTILNNASELLKDSPPSKTKRETSCMVLLYKAKIKASEALSSKGNEKKKMIKELSGLLAELKKIPNYLEILAKRGESEGYRDVESSLSILEATVETASK